MSYTSENIQTLRFPENIQHAPGLFIGSVDDDGRWLTVRECLDNGLDEFLAGRNTGVILVEDKDGSYWIYDKGAGIPQGIKTFNVLVNNQQVKSKMPTMQAVFSEMHTSGKYRSDAYKTSIGVFGVGCKASNALSQYFDVVTCYQDNWYSIGFKDGKLVSPVASCEAPIFLKKKLSRGTLIHLKQNPKFFPDNKIGFPLEKAKSWSEITSYLNPGFTILIIDKSGNQYKYHSKEGAKEFVNKILSDLKAEAESTFFEFKNELADVVVSFSNAEGNNIRGYTNGLYNSDGGKHVDSVANALFNACKPYSKSRQTVSAYDFKEGLVGIVNMHLHKAEFSSQDKLKLTDSRAGADFQAVLEKEATNFFKNNKALAQRLCEKASKLSELRNQFKASKKMITALNSAKKRGMPAKYAPYDSKSKIEDRELLIVEGESAGGSLREVRASYQAMLPLKGKCVNVLRCAEQRALESEEIINILSAVGYDPKSENPAAKLQVSRVICLADHDDDGPLAPNTKVLLCNGTTKTIKELADQWEKDHAPFYIWALDKDGNVHKAKAIEPRVTCYKDKYAIVEFDDGTSIKCTLSHKFVVKKSIYEHIIDAHGIHYICASNIEPGDIIIGAKKDGSNYVYDERTVTRLSLTSENSFSPYYCLTVPAYGNFLLEGKNGTAICSSNCHINTLLLTIFYRFLPQMFDKGMIYVADMPEFYAEYKNTVVIGQTLSEVKQKLADLGAPKSTPTPHIKGWGEISQQLLKSLVVDKSTRKLIRIKPITDNDRVTFVRVMNEDVAFRRQMLGLSDSV